MRNLKNTNILLTKWKKNSMKRKTTLGQPNLGNPLLEDKAST